VLNDAATFPASMRVRFGNEYLELRLLPKQAEAKTWTAVLMGSGSWRDKTEDREAPPHLSMGDLLRPMPNPSSAPGGEASRHHWGKPVQYSYLDSELELWSVQNVYAGRPWAAELPSAGRPLDWSLLSTLKERGIQSVVLTHSKGLSATGDAHLDQLLPLEEFFEIPEAAAEAIQGAKTRGSKVIAVGTSVVRALESAALEGPGGLTAVRAKTRLRLHSGSPLQVVDGIISGLHELGESHFGLLEAFVPRQVLVEAMAEAEGRGYVSHEFGDTLIIS